MSSAISEGELTELMHLMHMQPHKRQTREVQRIAKLTKWVKFFQDYDDSVHEACCRLMKSCECVSGSYVFHKGDPGDSFYIILRGLVSVLIPATKLSSPALPPPLSKVPKEAVKEAPPLSTSKRILSYTRNQLAVSVIQRGSMMLRGPPLVLQQSRPQANESMIEVSCLSAGNTFGELSLLQEARRSASILCKEHTMLAVLTKESFNTVLREYEEKKLNEKIAFIRAIPAFAGLSKQSVSKLTYYLKERKYKRNNVIYQEGDVAGEVFIVLNGEFKLTKIRKFSRDSPDKTVRASSTQAQLQVVIKGPREIFGETEVLSDQLRTMNCVCVSTTGHLWAIAKYDFLRKLQSAETWSIINRRHEEKQRWVADRLHQLADIEEMKYRTVLEAPKTPIRLSQQEVTSLTSRLKRYSNTVLDSTPLKRTKSVDKLRIEFSPHHRRSNTGSDWAHTNTARGSSKLGVFLRKLHKHRATGSIF